jgi:hypothetical protein
MPAIRVFSDGKKDNGYVLSRGFHRVEAARKAGLSVINAEIVRGSIEDAKDDALGSNFDHGQPRSNADKRCEVMLALSMEKYKDATDRAIADKCHVSHVLVGQVRAELGEAPTEAPGTTTTPGAEGAKGGDGATEAGPAPAAAPKVRVGKDGKKYKAKKKGARQAAGSKFCDRCARVGPVKGCAKCKELNGGKEPTGKPKAGTSAAPKAGNGEPVFAIQTFKTAIGGAIRECYKLARQYKHLNKDNSVKEPPELKKIRAVLDKAIKDVEAWRQQLVKRDAKAKQKAKV